MMRLLLRLLGIKDFEVCASCETLKQQLAIANAEKKEAIETLLTISKPKPVIPYEPTNTVKAVTGVFGRRQAELEARDRAIAKARGSSFAAGNLKPPTEAEVAEAAAELEAEVKRQENAS